MSQTIFLFTITYMSSIPKGFYSRICRKESSRSRARVRSQLKFFAMNQLTQVSRHKDLFLQMRNQFKFGNLFQKAE